MTRHGRIACIVLLLGAGGASMVFAEETQRPQSLAERLSTLRFAWKKDSGEQDAGEGQSPERKARPSSGEPQPSSRTSSIRKAPKAAASAIRNRLPSLNPRDLIPRDVLSRKKGDSPSSATAPRTSSQQRVSTTRLAPQGVGSARARMMRDIRQRGSETELASSRVAQKPSTPKAEKKPKRTDTVSLPPTQLSRRPPARAGSVLSQQQPPTEPADQPQATRPSPTQSARVEMGADALRKELLGSFSGKKAAEVRSPAAPEKRELNKKLAAEIAREMAPKTSANPPSSVPAATKVALRDEKTEAPNPPVKKPTPVEKLAEKVNSPAVASIDQSEAPADAFAAGLQAPLSDRYAAPSEPVRRRPAPRATMPVQKKPLLVAEKPQPRSSAEIRPTRSTPQPDAQAGYHDVADNAFQRRDLFHSPNGVGLRRPRVETATVPQSTRSLQVTTAEAEVLMTEKMPLVASRVKGPRRISIGRKAEFSVVLANRGQASAEGLVARVRVPEWADLVATSANMGAAKRTVSQDSQGLIEWHIGRFDPHALAQLDLTLVAREGRPIELGVDWSHAPVGGKTVVEVQEPKLQLNLSGPDEVVYGKPQRYRVELSNPGTGPAEGVTIHLLPPGKSADEASSQPVGAIAVGETKTMEIELTAREAGELAILARATAAGGLEALAEKKMFCRKPGLEVDWRGPTKKYAGAEATYYFRVRNPGTATAEKVTFVVDLPSGFELQATSAGQSYDPAKRRLAWKIGSLRPGDDHYLQIRGVPNGGGANQFAIAAATADRLIGDSTNATTEVLAVADLKLDVRDPKGPVAVGEEVVYEVRVQNRGSSAAEHVSIVGFFSRGIEPHAVDGATYTLGDGRVSVGTIEALPAGAEKVVKILARADRPGAHVFRAEALCRDLDTKLAVEEMTRFYAEDSEQLDEAPQTAGAVNDFVYPR